LADGKATLPLLHALQHGSETQKQLIKTSLTEGSLAQFPAILDAIASTKAIEYTQSVAENEVKKALSALQILPDSVYKEALKDLAQYATARNH
jgi:octaprenyl-diphosphate synthase